MMRRGDIPYFVNKRVMWMERKKHLSLSNTPSHLHLQQATPSTPRQDRISELCDDLLHKILSFMPMQMSIQTSVLSKRWLHLWKHMHIVDFHTLPFSNTEPVDYAPIKRFLDSLESPNIQSFTVVGHVGHNSCPDVLVIDSCEGLLKVNIRGPNLKLKQLTFSWDFFDEEVDDEFLLLEVDAPGLSTLKYWGDLTKIRLKNCQGLEKIILQGVIEEINQGIADHIRELINQVTQVKILGVTSLFLQFRPGCWDPFCGFVWERFEEPEFAMVEGTGYQPYHGRFLKKLISVRIICFSGYDGEMMLVTLLLEKAVNLKKLELLWKSHPSDMTDNVLQIVIKDRSQKRYSGPGLVVKQFHEALIEEKVARFSRASPNAQVLFRSRWKF
ncbi:hypothetical protein CRYUN_Cryun19dG0142500 [Craigia yunnanensis]